MKFYILIISCFFGFSVTTQDEMISWSSSKRLEWGDFKGPPDTKSSAAATTASGISYEFSASMEGDNVFVDYKVNSFFYPQQSWYKRDLASPTVLRHEQLHFDITELHARKMRAILHTMKFTQKVRKEIKRVYEEIIRDLQQMQKQYDKESDYSRNPVEQKKWELKIKDLLTSN